MLLLLAACDGPDECEGDACDSAVVDSGDTGTDFPGQDIDRDGYVADEDCNDGSSDINPGQTEICYDGLDNNCSATPDDCGWIGDMQTEAYGHLVSGEAGNDAAGLALDAGGDVDGDGMADLLMGAPNHSSSTAAQGAAYLLRGPFEDEVELPGGADAKILGAEEYGASAGTIVRFVPDVDGDGLSDLLVVAGRFNDIEDGARSPEIFLLPGTIRGEVSLVDHVPFVPAEDHDGAGVAVAVTHDVDGDGLPTLFIAAPDAAKVYRLDSPVAGASLADGAVLGGPVGFGADVALVGDLDGDGLEDLGVSGAEGVWIFAREGAANEQDAFAFVAHDASGLWSTMPGQMIGGGDLDGDGGADLVLASPGAETSVSAGGRVCVWSGSALGLASTLAEARGCVEGEHVNEALGASLSAPGDVDSDGASDLLIGVPANSKFEASHGAVLVAAGPIVSTITSGDVRATIFGETSYQLTGTALSPAAELTGDAVFDVVIGAPGASSIAGNAGGVFVFPGIIP